MVAEVHNRYTQSVSERNECNCSISWESFKIQSIEGARLSAQQHLFGQIEKNYGLKENAKLKSLILSRDAQLHINASSLPSLTVKRRNVIFPTIFPTHSKPQQSTPLFIWPKSIKIQSKITYNI